MVELAFWNREPNHARSSKFNLSMMYYNYAKNLLPVEQLISPFLNCVRFDKSDVVHNHQQSFWRLRPPQWIDYCFNSFLNITSLIDIQPLNFCLWRQVAGHKLACQHCLTAVIRTCN